MDHLNISTMSQLQPAVSSCCTVLPSATSCGHPHTRQLVWPWLRPWLLTLSKLSSSISSRLASMSRCWYREFVPLGYYKDGSCLGSSELHRSRRTDSSRHELLLRAFSGRETCTEDSPRSGDRSHSVQSCFGEFRKCSPRMPDCSSGDASRKTARCSACAAQV